jgi:CHAD domain-containing protein
MAQRQREREEKYDVGPRFGIPDLADLVPAGGRIERGLVHLDSRYFDTAERDLLANGVTLRRRSGDTDTGWQLKVPEGKARTEIRLPAEDVAVPDELARLVRGVSLGKPLVEVARVRSERTVRRIQGPDDSTVIEVADDQVHAAALGTDAALSQWREVEVELGSGDEADLDAVREQLVRVGARTSKSSSKLARALDAEADEEPSEMTSGHVVTDYLRRQHAELVAGDVALRQGKDAIHATRVATRRIRSTLRIFGALFDQRRARQLDADLAWYAEALGDVRDRQVQRARFADAIGEMPDDFVTDSDADDVDEWLQAEQQERKGRLQRALDSTRYLELLNDVRIWAQAAPFTSHADAAPSALKDFTRRARRKAKKRMRQAVATAESASAETDEANGQPAERVDAALHRARKAAKRARYAVELAAPIDRPKRAKKIIKRYKALQDLLGEHQDAVVAAQLLRDHAARAATPPSLTYGLLYAREESTAQRTRDLAVKSSSDAR